MARHQYLLSTIADGSTGFGNAYLAFLNQSGSGRKLVLRSLEVYPLTGTAGASVAAPARLLYGDGPVSGENCSQFSVRMDSSVSLPSGVAVRRLTGWPGGGITRHQNTALFRRGSGYGAERNVGSLLTRVAGRHLFGGLYNRGSTRTTTAVEPLVVPAGKAWVLAMEDGLGLQYHTGFRVNVVLRVDGKTVVWDFYTASIPGLGLFSVENTGSAVVSILSYSLTEVGTTDTPYLRLVPVGQLDAGDLEDTKAQVGGLLKMNSLSPDLTALKVLGNVSLVPQGSPTAVFSQGSSGTPKNMNYLHTRDFDGPLWRVLLPDFRISSGVGSTTDTLGMHSSPRRMDLSLRTRNGPLEGISLNPGEGVALTGSAETMISGGGYGGWPILMFNVMIDSVPQISPTLTLTGLKNPSEVRVFSAGSTTELAGAETITGGVFQWAYDPDLVSSVDISVLSLGYQNLRFLSVATTGDVGIPVQQVVDRQYQNA
jgi:hypothetical protein